VTVTFDKTIVNAFTPAAARSRRSARELDTLIRDQAPRLLSYFARRISTQADAADLLSETLMIVWRKADMLPGDNSEAQMWMFGVAKRVLSGYRRGIMRRQDLADRLRDSMTTQPSASAMNGRELAAEHGRIDSLRVALAQLPPADRELIMLIHWDGFGVAEAGKILRLRSSAARSRYHRARKRLVALIQVLEQGRNGSLILDSNVD
jgi:RNA polymerase sigma-70 factor (ECF subfamily)